MGNLAKEIAKEQTVVDEIYRVLDDTRQRYRLRQREAEALGGKGTPQNLTERDAFAAHFGDQAARLEEVDDRLVFGRLDAEGETSRYIGRVGLRNQSDQQVLVDWRARAALPFYQATPAHPMGITRRRHIATKLRQVVGIEDELLDQQASEGTVLQGEGALMAALSKARDGQMGDIVATIQAEQDQVIRYEGNGMLVVQGGPGTGKTAVALHRAAYLLYAKRQQLEKSGVLIIGPSKTFLRYIERVLPALGETGVVYQTIGTLFPSVKTTLRDSEKVAALKGDLRMQFVARALVDDLERLPQTDQVLVVNGRKLPFTRELVSQAMDQARASGKPHNEAWVTYANYLVDALTDIYLSQGGSEDDRGWVREDIRSSLDVRRAVNLCWLPATAQTLLERLYASMPRLRRFFNETHARLLYREKGSPWTVEDVPILDELAELLGVHEDAAAARKKKEARAAKAAELALAQAAISNQHLGGGLVDADMLVERASEEGETTSLARRASADRTWTYGHVVVDEAQELSPLAWQMLLRRCPTHSFTVVGDLAQRSAQSQAKSWSQLLGAAARALEKEAVLTISYRTPKTIMDLANRVIQENGRPLPFETTPVREVEDCLEITQVPASQVRHRLEQIVAEETELLRRRYGIDQGQLAVICDEGDLELVHNWLGAQRCELSLVTPSGAKGLEYDSVILLEPAHMLKRSVGGLYVALTRPTYRLRVVHAFDLPAGF